MSYKQRVTIPQGYCFVPSCQSTSTSSRSTTTSTTTVFGPTLTAPVPNEKRAPDDTLLAKLGTETFKNNFPTDAPVVVGQGPVCIVFCEWAEKQERGEDSDDEESVTDLTPPIRPTGDTNTMATTTISSIIGTTTIQLAGRASTTYHGTKPMPTQTLGYVTTPTPTPSSQAHKLSGFEIAGTVIAALAGLALVLAVMWLITRKVRQVKARLNPHNRGVHRDREREIHEMENGVGVPEMGKHITGKKRQKSV